MKDWEVKVTEWEKEIEDYILHECGIDYRHKDDIMILVKLEIKKAVNEMSEMPCNCESAYKDRGLSSPDCPKCNWDYSDEILRKRGIE